MKSGAFSCCRKQQGAALVLALTVMTLVAITASYLTLDFERNARRVEGRMANSFSQHYSRGAEAIARLALREDREQNEVDHLGELWAQQQDFPLDEGITAGGVIRVRLEDLQGRLNINELQAKVSGNETDNSFEKRYTDPQKHFVRLLQTFEERPLSQSEAEEITDAVIDWLDADDSPNRPGGAESYYYQGVGEQNEDPGYRPANRLMVSLSELRLVKGVTPELYQLLLPHLSALPGVVGININTATPNVVRSINLDKEGEPLSQADAEELILERGDSGFSTMDDLNNTAVITALRKRGPLSGTLLSLSSSYFMLHAETVIAERYGYTRSTLYRDNTSVRVIGRELGRSPLILTEQQQQQRREELGNR